MGIKQSLRRMKLAKWEVPFKMTASVNPVRRMDITISLRFSPKSMQGQDSKSTENIIELVKEFFEEHATKWVFQLEDTKDNKHLQCRIVVKDRQRTGTLFNKLADHLIVPPKWIHVTPSSNSLTDFSYVMKTESRLSGPYGNMDMKAMQVEDLLADLPMEPWQEFIANEWLDASGKEVYNKSRRSILFCIDTIGGSGKSVLVKHLYLTRSKSTLVLPVTGTPAQMISSLIDAGPRSNYILDFPRARNRDKDWVSDMLFVIENLQNGMLMSCFYGKYKTMVFARPQIVVFTNWKLPELMSKDRYIYIYPKKFVKPEGEVVSDVPCTQ